VDPIILVQEIRQFFNNFEEEQRPALIISGERTQATNQSLPLTAAIFRAAIDQTKARVRWHPHVSYPPPPSLPLFHSIDISIKFKAV
jgi:hypothetical protein